MVLPELRVLERQRPRICVLPRRSGVSSSRTAPSKRAAESASGCGSTRRSVQPGSAFSIPRVEIHLAALLLSWIYNAEVLIAPGKVIGGRIEVDADLPEGASVTVLVMDDDGTFEADPETEKMLLEAMAQCRRGEVTPLKDLLAEMRRRERA